MTDWPVDVLIDFEPLDPCQVILPVEIVHGRSGITDQPDAPTATFTWESDLPPGMLGDHVHINERLQHPPATWADPVTTWHDGGVLWGGGAETSIPRFNGYIDSLRAFEAAGEVVSWDVGCVGWQAKLGYLPINISRPAEVDTERVHRIGLAAGINVYPVGTPGITLAAKVYEDVDALSALHEVCASTGGLLWQARDGFIMYGTATHRETFNAAVTFPCDVISDGLEWEQDTGQIINSVKATWGEDNESSHVDTPSTEAAWGVRHADVTTIAATEPDAEQLALLILRRRAWPYWGTPSVVVWADELTAAAQRGAAQVDVSSMIVLPLPLHAPGPTPSAPSLGVVEGWVETWGDDGHLLQLAVGDAARWNYVTFRDWAWVASEDWDYWTHGDWMDMLILGPTP